MNTDAEPRQAHRPWSRGAPAQAGRRAVPRLRRWQAGVALLLWAAAVGAADGVATMRIEGRIAPASGVVLPAAVSWIVELRDDARERALVEQRQTLSAQGWPAAFSLSVDAARLQAGRAYSVRAGALDPQGHVAWLSQAKPVRPGQAAVDVGLLSLAVYRFPGAFSSTLRCGDREISLGFIGSRLRLSTDDEVFDLDRKGPLQAQRFELANDATTFVVVGERGATVSVRAQLFEPCVNRGAVPPGAQAAPR